MSWRVNQCYGGRSLIRSTRLLTSSYTVWPIILAPDLFLHDNRLRAVPTIHQDPRVPSVVIAVCCFYERRFGSEGKFFIGTLRRLPERPPHSLGSWLTFSSLRTLHERSTLCKVSASSHSAVYRLRTEALLPRAQQGRLNFSSLIPLALATVMVICAWANPFARAFPPCGFASSFFFSRFLRFLPQRTPLR
jgi:hypothetical protein